MLEKNQILYPVYKPFLKGNESKYVLECINSTWISSKGQYIKQFEASFSDFINIDYAIAVCNGTCALHLALLSLGIGPMDEVIVPTFTYIASVNAIRYVGAIPIFVDSLEDSLQMDINDISKKITKKTKAIMAVHLYGAACEIDDLLKISQTNNLKLIEDCSEAIGTLYKNKHVGTFGDIGTFSFYGNKTISTGEGGMVVTQNKELFKLVNRLKGQGLAENTEYWHDIVGYNYRMTNIAAAIGLAQMELLPEILQKKRQIGLWYKQFTNNLPIRVHHSSNDILHSYWMVSIVVDSKEIRDQLRFFLLKSGIETRIFFHPAHKMPIYFCEESFPVAEKLASVGMNLPSYPDLMKEDVKKICDTIKLFYESI